MVSIRIARPDNRTDVRIVKENVKFAFFAEEFACSLLDGAEIRQVKSDEIRVLARGILERRDRLLSLFFAPRGDVHLGIVLEQGLPTGYLERCLW